MDRADCLLTWAGHGHCFPWPDSSYTHFGGGRSSPSNQSPIQKSDGNSSSTHVSEACEMVGDDSALSTEAQQGRYHHVLKATNMARLFYMAGEMGMCVGVGRDLGLQSSS